MKKTLLDIGALEEFLKNNNEKLYRVAQIEQAVFGDLKTDIEEFTTLSKDLRDKLKAEFDISPLTVEKDLVSVDGTNKVLFVTNDNQYVESVLMRHKTDRLTLCISSQVGCPVKCVFCSTGTMGYSRNLEYHEIAAQVLYFNQKLAVEGKRVRNIVFMGMGEPLLNYDNVMKAIDMLNDQKKFAIGVRHITISTSGIIPRIKELMANNSPVNLAVSLHAPNDELRTKIMPINKAHPLDKLMTVLKEYMEKTDKRIFYEYVMLKNLNDKPEHAFELAHLLKGQLAHVNLIPYNPGGAWADLECSSRNKIMAFQKILQLQDIPCTVRYTLGQDIDAACGQLAVKNT